VNRASACRYDTPTHHVDRSFHSFRSIAHRLPLKTHLVQACPLWTRVVSPCRQGSESENARVHGNYLMIPRTHPAILLWRKSSDLSKTSPHGVIEIDGRCREGLNALLCYRTFAHSLAPALYQLTQQIPSSYNQYFLIALSM
jgi:hypothetical protein